MIELTIPIKPKPAPRPRFTRAGHCYTPKAYADYKAAIAQCVKAKYKKPPLENAVKVELEFGLNVKNIISKRSGDTDNLSKGILDACNGVLWQDDSQILKLTAEKVKATPPYILMKVIK